MKYYVFEGVDGVGKTTTIKNVALELLNKNVNFILTKEPGGPAALADELKYCLPREYFGNFYNGFRDLCVDNPQIPALTKRGLYRADAFYNWEHVIVPALAEGKIILSDRNWVSDLAYGSVLTNCFIEQLYDFNMALTPEQAKITKVIYLSLPEEEREKRLAGNIQDSMDRIGRDTRNRIAEAYEKVLSTYISEENIKEFSTQKPESEVANNIVEWILS